MSKTFTIHDLPEEERPRERLAKFGEQALSAQELFHLTLMQNNNIKNVISNDSDFREAEKNSEIRIINV